MHLLCWGCLIQSLLRMFREREKKKGNFLFDRSCITIFFLNKGHSKLKGKSRGHVWNSLISISLTRSLLKNVLTAQEAKKKHDIYYMYTKMIKNSLVSIQDHVLCKCHLILFNECYFFIETGSIQNHRL